MPLPNLEMFHTYADAVLAVIRKANEFGVAVETAVQAFHDKYFEKHEPSESFRGSGSYEQLPAEMKAFVDDAVAGDIQS